MYWFTAFCKEEYFFRMFFKIHARERRLDFKGNEPIMHSDEQHQLQQSCRKPDRPIHFFMVTAIKPLKKNKPQLPSFLLFQLIFVLPSSPHGPLLPFPPASKMVISNKRNLRLMNRIEINLLRGCTPSCAQHTFIYLFIHSSSLSRGIGPLTVTDSAGVCCKSEREEE